MKPLDLTASREAPHALAALRAVALADATALTGEERELLTVHAEHFGWTEPLDAIPPLDLDALSDALPDPAHRAALVQRLVLMAMIDGSLDAREIAEARAIARHLGVVQPAIRQMELLLAGHVRRLTMDIGRRSFVAAKLKRMWKEQGLRAVLRFAKQSRGTPDPELAARYHALEALPEGTLGRELFAHFRRSGFALPGEAKSAPEALLFHDVGHVLAGYGTDPEGEVEMAGFEAGYMGEDGFSVTLLGLFLFQLGAAVVPNGMPAKGRFSLPRFRAAYRRGARITTDLRYWDPAPSFARPLAELRAELGVS